MAFPVLILVAIGYNVATAWHILVPIPQHKIIIHEQFDTPTSVFMQ